MFFKIERLRMRFRRWRYNQYWKMFGARKARRESSRWLPSQRLNIWADNAKAINWVECKGFTSKQDLREAYDKSLIKGEFECDKCGQRAVVPVKGEAAFYGRTTIDDEFTIHSLCLHCGRWNGQRV